MKHRKKKAQQRIAKLAIALCCLLSITFSSLPLTAFATTEPRVVRVGYYENEVFQEGAGEGLVKTGYAYEYYQKISEYTGMTCTSGSAVSARQLDIHLSVDRERPI